ncbi:hypothetical protein MKZ38_007268 [Zalerion maritima]|uniref:Palmitoyl-protein thioesterase 1 n=1 Tax=Zalerion maritima TaxID=339359 RepID=A0AAD5WWJ7_9PEZI|nr:hypothetical protein MKZ38_007268 [Zalerion maritima]
MRFQNTLGLLALLSSRVAIASPSPSPPLLQQQQQKPLRPTSDGDDENDTPLPLLIWHGLGDSFSAPGIRSVGELAEEVNPGTLVYYVRIGEDANSDRSATWFGNVTQQMEKVCEEINAHPILSTAPALDALGFSQGGQFLRGLGQMCEGVQLRSLLTFGSQHNGITEFKACGGTDWLCKSAMALLHGSTWSSWVQGRLVPAQYFRDPATEETYENYLEYSNFLADINNEREEKNAEYKKKIGGMSNFVMYMFEEDTVAIPKETSWFEEVNGTESVPLRARKLYTEDWLGLRELDRKGGVKFRKAKGDHMQLDDELLREAFGEFFGPMGKKFAVEDGEETIDEL